MKKIVIILFLVAVLSAYPIFNIAGISRSAIGSAEADFSEGNGVIEKLWNFDVKLAQKNVKTAQEKRTDPTGIKQKVRDTLKNLDNGKTTYRKVFRNVYIVGDSLMDGLEAYDILNSNHLITQVSASLYHLNDNVKKIIKINPPVLILHYGVNMIATEKKYLNNYIAMYTDIIEKLQASLPDTRIIVSGIFPVDRDIAKAKRFGMIGEYNKKLKAMCKELDVEYMDSSAVLKAHPECYGSDGIHLSKAFYEKYWLRFIIKEMEIVG
ncbi:MAG: hypothetical protein J6V06_06995 [Clostridia bacterium]|nr:hypothetical protein [Clostridia bacterium]